MTIWGRCHSFMGLGRPPQLLLWRPPMCSSQGNLSCAIQGVRRSRTSLRFAMFCGIPSSFRSCHHRIVSADASLLAGLRYCPNWSSSVSPGLPTARGIDVHPQTLSDSRFCHCHVMRTAHLSVMQSVPRGNVHQAVQLWACVEREAGGPQKIGGLVGNKDGRWRSRAEPPGTV